MLKASSVTQSSPGKLSFVHSSAAIPRSWKIIGNIVAAIAVFLALTSIWVGLAWWLCASVTDMAGLAGGLVR